ncbi:MAG: hypothetical protein JO108_31810 [Acidobacteriaceae bacterium]|nr:hypothetical protein [Acidobacteriaceae bacterium]
MAVAQAAKTTATAVEEGEIERADFEEQFSHDSLSRTAAIVPASMPAATRRMPSLNTGERAGGGNAPGAITVRSHACVARRLG